MKIDNKQCFSCIAKHICGPTVTPKMAICVNFRNAMEAVAAKPSRNTQQLKHKILLCKYKDYCPFKKWDFGWKLYFCDCKQRKTSCV